MSGNAILAQFATTPTPAPTPTPTPRGSRILTPAIPIPNPNTTVDSIVNGGPLNDLLIGSNSQADALNGFAGSDTIYGLDGADNILGEDGEDLLFGNAVITDFNSAEDVLVLSGVKADYSLSVSGNATSIFLKRTGQADNLIATVQGVTDLNLDRPYFTFI